jgi:hypothetical protein
MHSDTAIEMTDDVARKDTTIDIQNAKVWIKQRIFNLYRAGDLYEK